MADCETRTRTPDVDVTEEGQILCDAKFKPKIYI